MPFFLSAEFLDIFGSMAFLFIAAISFYSLKSNKPIPKSFLIVLFLIGAIGFIVDITIVTNTFILK